jgi:hypothetical protein
MNFSTCGSFGALLCEAAGFFFVFFALDMIMVPQISSSVRALACLFECCRLSLKNAPSSKTDFKYGGGMQHVGHPPVFFLTVNTHVQIRGRWISHQNLGRAIFPL